MSFDRKKNIAIALYLLLFFAYKSTCFADETNIGLVYSQGQFYSLCHGKDQLESYRKAIEMNGGKIIAISPTETKEIISDKKKLDGILLPGGIDVAPCRYGEKPHPKLEAVDEELDNFEIKIIQYAMKRKIPILGICRGEQVLNVALGGSLYQDIPSQYASDSRTIHRIKINGKTQKCNHRLSVEPQSRFYPDFKGGNTSVNSYHHQAVKTIGKDLQVTGVAPDGTVEIIEGTGQLYVVGVQFHPEKLTGKDKLFDVFFQTFLDAAKQH